MYVFEPITIVPGHDNDRTSVIVVDGKYCVSKEVATLHNDKGMPIVDSGEAVIELNGACVVDDAAVDVGAEAAFVDCCAVAPARRMDAKQHTLFVRTMLPDESRSSRLS